MPTLLITGANRGLGLEFCRQYLADGWRVLACCRAPERATALAALDGDLEIYGLDVADEASIAALAREIDEPIDLLINNAGIFQRPHGRESFQTLTEVDASIWLEELRVNTVAPVLVARAFQANLEAAEGAKLVTISSILGSVTQNTSGALYYYRTSKAAVNMAMRSLAADWTDRGIIVVPVHPGWVQTDMGGPQATIAPPESIAGLRRLIAGLTPKQSGQFFDYSGKGLDW